MLFVITVDKLCPILRPSNIRQNLLGYMLPEEQREEFSQNEGRKTEMMDPPVLGFFFAIRNVSFYLFAG